MEELKAERDRLERRIAKCHRRIGSGQFTNEQARLDRLAARLEVVKAELAKGGA